MVEILHFARTMLARFQTSRVCRGDKLWAAAGMTTYRNDEVDVVGHDYMVQNFNIGEMLRNRPDMALDDVAD